MEFRGEPSKASLADLNTRPYAIGVDLVVGLRSDANTEVRTNADRQQSCLHCLLWRGTAIQHNLLGVCFACKNGRCYPGAKVLFGSLAIDPVPTTSAPRL
jgi:hypothetical protein